MRVFTAIVVVCSALLAAAAAAQAAPPPPAKFWTVSGCERAVRAHDYAIRTADGFRFHVGQAVCVGAGGSTACRWTSRRSRVYSTFTVFTRSRYVGGIVRSWKLVTRGGDGLVAVRHHAGDQYAGWPADFYMAPASVEILAPSSSPAHFRSIVAPVAGRLRALESATACSRHG